MPGVRTASVAGECLKPWLGVEWQFSSRLVGKTEGPNDGVVSVASAAWGERREVWPGDHLNLVNWPNRLMVRAGDWHDRGPGYVGLLHRFNRQIDRDRSTLRVARLAPSRAHRTG